jgi:hypothetical protein
MKRYLIFFAFIFFCLPQAYCNFFHDMEDKVHKNAEAQKEIEIKRQKSGAELIVNDSYATNWLDNFHDSLFITVQGQITRADTMFVQNKQSLLNTPHSNFEISLYTEMEQGGDGVSFAIEPKFDIDLAIPNLEESLKLYVSTTPIGSLPGIDPIEEERQLHIGIQSTIARPDSWWPRLSTSVGVDWDWPPDPYVELSLKKYMNFGNLRLYPNQTFWLNTTDRLSEKSTIRTDYWLSPNMLSTVWSSIKYTQDNGYFNWEQSQSVIYCLNGYGLDMNEDKMHYCSLKFSMFGENTVMTTYRVTMQYKFPIYKDWIFLEITPELKWEKETNWESIRVFRVGISALFWGVYNKQQ